MPKEPCHGAHRAHEEDGGGGPSAGGEGGSEHAAGRVGERTGQLLTEGV